MRRVTKEGVLPFLWRQCHFTSGKSNAPLPRLRLNRLSASPFASSVILWRAAVSMRRAEPSPLLYKRGEDAQ
jgi:hypothetical protein